MKKTSITLSLLACLLLPLESHAAFGLTTTTDYYQVDTGAGLVFKVRRVEESGVNPNTVSIGDIRSLIYNGVEYQDSSRGTQINSGFDWLGYGTSTVNVSAQTIGTDYIKITVTTDHLIHYYMVRKGDPKIYMATWFDVQPVTGGGLCRFIVRIPHSKLPNGSGPAELGGIDYTVESGDIFGYSPSNSIVAYRGQTRSKHYSNMRLNDWSYFGATGSGVGAWMVRDDHEGGSGGPFYRSLLQQGGGDQELTYIVNYGEVQTESFRTSILNHYTLVFTDGSPPGPVDTSWFDGMGLVGYVPPSGRGSVSGSGITGRDPAYTYTVGLANTNAQFWAAASSTDGSFSVTNVLPGTYDVTVYKNELEVYSDTVSVTAGNDTAMGPISIANDPSAVVPVWRIGEWDGSPTEFLNGDKITTMHPSDIRMSDWNAGTYVVGSSTPGADMPCYKWTDVADGSKTIQFTLTADQIVDSVLRVGITVAYSGARPDFDINGWNDGVYSSISSQPGTRSLTVGSYRGNNTMYTFNIPASALQVGVNTLNVYPISGSGSTGFLSAGYSLDCIDFYDPGAQPVTPELKALYLFDGNANDSSGNGYNATANGTPAYTTGQNGQAINLDGTSDYVTLPAGIANTHDMTIATWVYWNGGGNWQRLFDFGNGTSDYLFLTPSSGNNTLRFATRIGGGTEQRVETAQLATGQWVHLAIKLEGDTATLYENGSPVASNPAVTIDPIDFSPANNYIGDSQYSADPFFNGWIDDFRIYTYALDDATIAAIANGLDVDPPQAPAGLAATAGDHSAYLSWTDNTEPDLDHYTVYRSLSSGSGYSAIASNVATNTFTDNSATNDTTYYYVVTATDTSSNESGYSVEADATPVSSIIPAAHPIAYYRFEEGTAGATVPFGTNAVVDSAGGDDNMNAFSLAEAPDYSANVPSSTIPQTGETNTLSAYFDGSDDLYTATSGPLVTTLYTNFTVEAYVNFSSLANFQTIVGRDDDFVPATGGVDGNLQSLFYLSKHSDNHFRVEVSTVGGDLQAVEGSVYASTGTWYHVAAVGNASAGTLTLYVNGTAVGSTTGFDGLYPTTTHAWTIGRGQYDGAIADNLNGYIDEVRITNEALTPAQMLNSFNPDFDGDGLADAWERQYFGNLNQSGTDDPDGDGQNNATEEANGTDPTISSIPPAIGISVSGGMLNLNWPSNNTGWRLMFRTNLVSGAWEEISGSDTNHVYEGSLPNDRAYYKLVYP